MPLPAPSISEVLQQLRRITAQRLRDLTELDHVQATLASLYLRHEALWLSQLFRELDLSDASRLPH